MTMELEEKAAGFCFGVGDQHLDHVAVLAALLGLPLVVSDERIARLARKFYPTLQVKEYYHTVAAQKIVQDYDCFFSALPSDLLDGILFLPERLLNKKNLRIYLPHGNSDKGYAAPIIEELRQEQIALVYGQKMIDLFKEKKIYSSMDQVIEIGNFRYHYFKQHEAFYDQLLKEIPLDRSKKTLFYAPTWEDSESSGSFFEALPILVERLTHEHNLMVKVHPNTLLFRADEMEQMKERYRGRENLFFYRGFSYHLSST